MNPRTNLHAPRLEFLIAEPTASEAHVLDHMPDDFAAALAELRRAGEHADSDTEFGSSWLDRAERAATRARQRALRSARMVLRQINDAVVVAVAAPSIENARQAARRLAVMLVRQVLREGSSR